jgi:hypothetical protein
MDTWPRSDQMSSGLDGGTRMHCRSETQWASLLQNRAVKTVVTVVPVVLEPARLQAAGGDIEGRT